MAIFALAVAVMRETFHPKLIPMPIGIISATFSLGVSLGFLAGGALLSVVHFTVAFFTVAPILGLPCGYALRCTPQRDFGIVTSMHSLIRVIGNAVGACLAQTVLDASKATRLLTLHDGASLSSSLAHGAPR